MVLIVPTVKQSVNPEGIPSVQLDPRTSIDTQQGVVKGLDALAGLAAHEHDRVSKLRVVESDDKAARVASDIMRDFSKLKGSAALQAGADGESPLAPFEQRWSDAASEIESGLATEGQRAAFRVEASKHSARLTQGMLDHQLREQEAWETNTRNVRINTQIEQVRDMPKSDGVFAEAYEKAAEAVRDGMRGNDPTFELQKLRSSMIEARLDALTNDPVAMKKLWDVEGKNLIGKTQEVMRARVEDINNDHAAQLAVSSVFVKDEPIDEQHNKLKSLGLNDNAFKTASRLLEEEHRLAKIGDAQRLKKVEEPYYQRFNDGESLFSLKSAINNEKSMSPSERTALIKKFDSLREDASGMSKAEARDKRTSQILVPYLIDDNKILSLTPEDIANLTAQVGSGIERIISRRRTLHEQGVKVVIPAEIMKSALANAGLRSDDPVAATIKESIDAEILELQRAGEKLDVVQKRAIVSKHFRKVKLNDTFFNDDSFFGAIRTEEDRKRAMKVIPWEVRRAAEAYHISKGNVTVEDVVARGLTLDDYLAFNERFDSLSSQQKLAERKLIDSYPALLTIGEDR